MDFYGKVCVCTSTKLKVGPGFLACDWPLEDLGDVWGTLVTLMLEDKEDDDKLLAFKHSGSIVMFLSFRTDRSGQTV